MDKSQTAKLLKLISSTWPNFKMRGADTVNAWQGILSEVEFDVACKAIKNLALNKPGEFAPSIQEISAEVKHLIFPRLKLSYEQAKEQNAPLYRKALKQVTSHYKPWTPYADPDAMAKESDQKFIEHNARRAYAELVDSMKAKPVSELIQLATEKKQLDPKVTSLVEQTSKRVTA